MYRILSSITTLNISITYSYSKYIRDIVLDLCGVLKMRVCRLYYYLAAQFVMFIL